MRLERPRARPWRIHGASRARQRSRGGELGPIFRQRASESPLKAFTATSQTRIDRILPASLSSQARTRSASGEALASLSRLMKPLHVAALGALQGPPSHGVFPVAKLTLKASGQLENNRWRGGGKRLAGVAQGCERLGLAVGLPRQHSHSISICVVTSTMYQVVNNIYFFTKNSQIKYKNGLIILFKGLSLFFI